MSGLNIETVGLIEIKNKKVLVVRSKGIDLSYMPGGKREKGETDEEALIRELKEELDIEIIPSTISFYGTFEAQAHARSGGTLVTMSCFRAEFNGKFKSSSEIEEYAYLSYDQKNQTPPLGNLIFDDLKQKGLID